MWNGQTLKCNLFTNVIVTWKFLVVRTWIEITSEISMFIYSYFYLLNFLFMKWNSLYFSSVEEWTIHGTNFALTAWRITSQTFHTCFIPSKGLFPALPGSFIFVRNEMCCLLLLCSVLRRLQCTVCNVLHDWSREQKNEQRNNIPTQKKQCSCKLWE